MKKLMIAAAIVCAAVVSQAASIEWAISGKNKLKSKGNVNWANQTVYLVLDSQQAAIIEALNAGTFTDSMALDKGTTTGNSNITTPITTTKDKSILTGVSEGGDPYNFALLMIDTTSVAGETWYRFSPTLSEYAFVSGTDDPTGITFEGDKFNAVGWSKAGGSPVPVPEPTSAMLLVFGLGALALRRLRSKRRLTACC